MPKIKTTHGGHWGLNMMDAGAVWEKYIEALIAYDISKKIAQRTGAKEVSDRLGATVNDNLYNLVANMNTVPMGDDDFHISNHLNAFNKSANGVEVWYYAGDKKGAEMARKMSAAIAKALGLVDRGAKPTMDLYVVSNSNGHTLLIEWCFIDVKKDVESLIKNMDKAVDAMIECFGYKTNNGGNKPMEDKFKNVDKNKYYTEKGGFHAEALIDIKLYANGNLADKNQYKTPVLKKGSRFYIYETTTGGTADGKTIAIGQTRMGACTVNKSCIKLLNRV